MNKQAHSISIRAIDRRLLDQQLDAAVERLQQIAMLEGTQGILVTRHMPERYTAELSDAVPFGQTLERSAARPSP